MKFSLYRVCLSVGVLTAITLSTVPVQAQPAQSFELRYFSPDKAADGETDFKGKTAVFTTEQRVDFLKHYADLARQQFNDPQLNTTVVTNAEIAAALQRVKALPRPSVRQRLPLDTWRWLGFRAGQPAERRQALARYDTTAGVKLEQQHLRVNRRSEPLACRTGSAYQRQRLVLGPTDGCFTLRRVTGASIR